MMVEVVFHGYLKNVCPPGIRMDAGSVAELFRGLSYQIPGLKPTPDRGRHCVRVLGYDTVDDLYRPIRDDVIHVFPALYGGKGFFRILIGAIIIAAAIHFSGGTLALAMASTWGSIAISLGVSLVLGGLLELLSPAPKVDLDTSGVDERSKYLGGSQNTVRIGTRIPLLYGERRVHGHYISFNVDAVDLGETPEVGESTEAVPDDPDTPEDEYQGPAFPGDK